MSSSGKLLVLHFNELHEGVGVATGSAAGKLLLLQTNLPLLFTAGSTATPRVCFETISILTGHVLNACFSLEDHCCSERRSTQVRWITIQGTHVEMFQISKGFDDSTHLEGIVSA
jgi:hypothetical protein